MADNAGDQNIESMTSDTSEKEETESETPEDDKLKRDESDSSVSERLQTGSVPDKAAESSSQDCLSSEERLEESMDTEQPQSDADGMQAEGAADMNATVLYENIPVGPPRVASDSEGRQCYCGKPRELGTVELQCTSCMKWFHSSCITCYLGTCVPFMTNYQFCCKSCSPKNLESFNKKPASFGQMCYTAIANLMLKYQKKAKVVFSKDKEIIPYIDKHWDSLTSMPRRIKLTWHTTIAKTMLKESDVFVHVEEVPGDSHFGLIHQDLFKIGPTNELTVCRPGPGVGRPGEARTFAPAPELPAKGRGMKRKLPDNQQLSNFKQKRSDMTSLAKLATHGYPMEHPYNKDGYRYILAESDPHAPNRQAFDESLDWAGKPIPPYLYRIYLGSEVLMALHDRAPQLKISDDRLSVLGEKGYSMVRATHGIRYGSWFYEVTIDDLPQETATRIGWSQALGNLQAPCGYDKFSYSWRSKKGTCFHHSRGKHYSMAGYGEGDVLGFYIHLPEPDDPGQLLPTTFKDRPLVKFKSHFYYEEKDYVTEAERNLKPLPGSKMVMFRNGKHLGVAFTNLHEGVYYPSVSLYKNCMVKFNFGPDFQYPPQDMGIYKPMSDAAFQSMIDYALSDIVYHVENEGNVPEF